jgi:hypothetical protein
MDGWMHGRTDGCMDGRTDGYLVVGFNIMRCVELASGVLHLTEFCDCCVSYLIHNGPTLNVCSFNWSVAT